MLILVRLAVQFLKARGYVVVPQAAIDDLTRKVRALDGMVNGYQPQPKRTQR